ncbi:hypothetical protein D3C87_1832380 [compost metagenome]
MQAENPLEPEKVLQLLFPVGQAIVFQHPFALAFEQENAAGRFGNVQQRVLGGLVEKSLKHCRQFVLMTRVEMERDPRDFLPAKA